MADKDYQNLSTQASGSITKVTPFQIKSNDGLGSLAIDLEAFRGQLAGIIGVGAGSYKENLSGSNYDKVHLTNLKNHIDAASGSSLNIRQGLIITGSAIFGSSINVAGTSTFGTISASTMEFTSASINGNAGIAGNLSVTGSSILGAVSAGTITFSSASITTNAGIVGNLSVTGSSILNGDVKFGGDILSSAPGSKNIFAGAGNNTIAIGGSTTTSSFSGAVTIGGDLTINGTTTTINSTTVTVDDKNIVLGAVAGATDAGADGGGITLSGSTDHTIIWRDASDAWEFSENVIANGNGTKDLGNASNRWRNVFAGTGSFSNGTNIVTVRHDALFGSNILTVSASAGDVILDDKWRTSLVTTAGSTPGIKVASAATDWTDFNSNFSTKNSILGALNQVATATSNPRKLTYNISASYASGTSVPVNLGTFADSVTFSAAAMTGRNSLVFYNGQLLGSGSTAAVQAFPATADYSVNAGLDNFRFGFPVSNGDIVVIKLD